MYGKRGAALILTLSVLLLLAALGAGLLAAAMADVRTVSGHRSAVSAFHAAEGGVQEVQTELERVFWQYLPGNLGEEEFLFLSELELMDGAEFLLTYGGIEDQLTVLEHEVDRLVLGIERDLTSGSYVTQAVITCDDRYIDYALHGNRYGLVFEYSVELISEGLSGVGRRELISEAEYVVMLTRLSFARFLIFTDIHEGADGTDIWFQSHTEFAGWVHTNDYFRIWGNPTFHEGPVTQSGTRVKFYPNQMVSDWRYGNQYPIMLDADGQQVSDEDVFFYRGIHEIEMPTQAFSQQWAALGEVVAIDDPLSPPDPPNWQQIRSRLAMPAGGPIPDDIYIAHDGWGVSGGIYVQGDLVTAEFGIDAQGRQVITLTTDSGVIPDPDQNYEHTLVWYQNRWRWLYICDPPADNCQYLHIYTHANGWHWAWVCSSPPPENMQRTAVITIDRDNDMTDVEWIPYDEDIDPDRGKHGENLTVFTQDGRTRATQTFSGIPNGVTYVAGGIGRANQLSGFKGMIARDEKYTVVTEQDLHLSGHVEYEQPPTFGDDDAENMLGLVSVDGDIVIHRHLTGDLYISAVVMAPNGVYRVDRATVGSPRGVVYHLGGVATKRYGIFGTANDGVPLTGYGRSFIYDWRMMRDAPPSYPETRLFLIEIEGEWELVRPGG